MYCDFTPDKRYQLADWRIRLALFKSLSAYILILGFKCRPLPEEMLTYARSDTHFLLYIYDNLRNALLDRALSQAETHQPSLQSHDPPTSTALTSTPPLHDPSHALMREVLSRSEETALCTYEPQSYDTEGGSGSGGWEALIKKWNKGTLVEGPQRNVFLAVHAWRDRVAREDDESTRYVFN
jgi:exosome complex exonuclease RRP6